MVKKQRYENQQTIIESGDWRVVRGSMKRASLDDYQDAQMSAQADEQGFFYAAECKKGSLWLRQGQIGFAGLFGPMLTPLGDIPQEIWDVCETLPDRPADWFVDWKPKSG